MSATAGDVMVAVLAAIQNGFASDKPFTVDVQVKITPSEPQPTAKPGEETEPKAMPGCDWEVDIFQRRVYMADNSTQRAQLVRERDQAMRRAFIARVRERVLRMPAYEGNDAINEFCAILDEESK